MAKRKWVWMLGIGGAGCLAPILALFFVLVILVVGVLSVFYSGGNTTTTNAALLPGAPVIGTPMTVPLLWWSTLQATDPRLSNSVGMALISAESSGATNAMEYWCNNTLTGTACTTGQQGMLGGLLQLGSPGWAQWGLTQGTVTNAADNLAVGLRLFGQVRAQDPWLSTAWNTFQHTIQPQLPTSGATATTFQSIVQAYAAGPLLSAWPVTGFAQACWIAPPNGGRVPVIAVAAGPYGPAHQIGWTAPYTTVHVTTTIHVTHPKTGKNHGKTVTTKTVTRTTVHHAATYLADPTLVRPTSVVATGQGQTIPLQWTGNHPNLKAEALLYGQTEAYVAELPPPPHGTTHWTITARWQRAPQSVVSTPLGQAKATGTGSVVQQTATVILNAQQSGCIPATVTTSGPWQSSGTSTNVGQSSTLSPSQAIAVLAPYLNDIDAASKLTGVPAAFIGAEIIQESEGDPNVVSVDGAMGLMQLEPGTWMTWASAYGLTNPFNPAQNIIAGSAYLASLYARWHGWRLTSAAYYSGGGYMTMVTPGESWTLAGPLLNWGGSTTLEDYANSVHATEQGLLGQT